MTTLEYIQRVETFRSDLYHDGDSFYLETRIPFHLKALINVRLAGPIPGKGFDCPELRKGSEYERKQGQLAREMTTGWLEGGLALPNPWRMYIRTEPIEDDFGRWLGDIWLEHPDGTIWRLGDLLRSNKLASIWPQKWREEFDHTIAK